MVSNSVVESISDLEKLLSQQQQDFDLESSTNVLQKLTGLMRCPETK